MVQLLEDFDPPKNMTGYIPGHSFGQYLSGLARAYAVTGDRSLHRQKVHRLVRGFAATITPKFYEGYRLPAYTFDKTNCGLIDAHEFAARSAGACRSRPRHRRRAAFPPERALNRAEMAARPHPEHRLHMGRDLHSAGKFLSCLQARSGRPLSSSSRSAFCRTRLLRSPRGRGKRSARPARLQPRKRALLRHPGYLTTGSEKHLRAARNGFDFVLTTQSFATGGWGPDESFRQPGSGDLGASLTKTHASFETPCGAYGHFKITRYLLRVYRRQPLRRQHGEGALQHHPRR